MLPQLLFNKPFIEKMLLLSHGNYAIIKPA